MKAFNDHLSLAHRTDALILAWLIGCVLLGLVLSQVIPEPYESDKALRTHPVPAFRLPRPVKASRKK